MMGTHDTISHPLVPGAFSSGPGLSGLSCSLTSASCLVRSLACARLVAVLVYSLCALLLFSGSSPFWPSCHAARFCASAVVCTRLGRAPRKFYDGHPRTPICCRRPSPPLSLCSLALASAAFASPPSRSPAAAGRPAPGPLAPRRHWPLARLAAWPRASSPPSPTVGALFIIK